MQIRGTPLKAIAFYHVDLEKSVMSTEDGDKPVNVTNELISWKHSKPTRDGKTQTEEGSINRIDGSLVVVTSTGDRTDRSETRGTCSGAK